MAARGFRRVVAGAVVLALFLAVANLPVLAADNALFRGRVLAADGVSPKPGVVVMLVDREADQSFESAPADERGYFRVDSAPAGTYRVVARASEGAFLAADAVTLEPGRNKAVALSLKTNAETKPSGTSASGTMEPWVKWVIVGGIAIGALVVADAITKDESPASPL